MLKSLRSFFYDIRQEIKKIAWVKRRDVISSLFVVVIVILCFSIFFCFIDFISLYVVKALFGIVYDI
ncbi:preprotein translocase subunit SecE [Wolbachia pipientis]|uniref:preprotein translocase subunit SecE n=1 Tax=Wolbachia pipientis TaxID=955 RepID=UPI0009BEBEBE|nr:preprotein translocase subunit SecE [Wolbachia pipientis]